MKVSDIMTAPAVTVREDSTLEQVARVMAPGGVIWFSTNHRRFKLQLPRPWAHTDETRATLPPDFRDAKIHQAWRIELP